MNDQEWKEWVGKNEAAKQAKEAAEKQALAILRETERAFAGQGPANSGIHFPLKLRIESKTRSEETGKPVTWKLTIAVLMYCTDGKIHRFGCFTIPVRDQEDFDGFHVGSECDVLTFFQRPEQT